MPRTSSSLEGALLADETLREWASRSAWTRRADYEQLARAFSAVLTRSVMGEALAASGKEIVGDKSPLNGAGVVAATAELLPDARIVHIVRDGRDVAVSAIHHRWNQHGSDPEVIARNPAEFAIRDDYRASPEQFLAAGRSLFGEAGPERQARVWAEQTEAARAEGRKLGAGRYAEVTYESLLDDGAPTLLQLFGFLGAEASVAVAERCLRANDFRRGSAGREPGTEDSTAFLRSGVAGDWQRVFTANDKDVFKRVAGATLIALGYARDSDW